MLHLDTFPSIEILDLNVYSIFYFLKHLSITWMRLCVIFIVQLLFPISFDDVEIF